MAALLVDDFFDFDLILALDNTHLAALENMKPDNARAHVALFLAYTDCSNATEVPDPYYGGVQDFEYVLDLIESGVKPLADKLQQLQPR